MHCLEVIVARNERAAGRELGHADNDHDFSKATQILDASPVHLSSEFIAAYWAAREEN